MDMEAATVHPPLPIPGFGRGLNILAVAAPGVPDSWQGVDGYGRGRVPTRFMMRIGGAGARGRWHRVYATAYSNVSSFFVEVAGCTVWLGVEGEQLLDTSSDADAYGEDGEPLDENGRDTFSRTPCDSCGTRLAGARNRFQAFQPA